MTRRKQLRNFRSAETGEFVTAEYAEKHPRTTVSERRRRRKNVDRQSLRR